MEIEMTNSTVIKQIQESFNTAYPNLWIEFLHRTDAKSNLFKREKILPETALKFLCAFDGIKTINIDGFKSVSQIEEEFFNTTGLMTRVLRKSGNAWVGISYTGNWTLNNQNFEGGQILLDYL